MIRIANQIFSVCVWLTNFQPALIPVSQDIGSDNDVETYFESLETDYDADSESSDNDV